MSNELKGLPYMGSGGSTFKSEKALEIEQKQKVAKEKSAETRSKLLPAGELISELLQKEIDKFNKTDFEAVKIAIASAVPNALEIDMLSNAKTVQSLESIKTSITNSLRDNKGTK